MDRETETTEEQTFKVTFTLFVDAKDIEEARSKAIEIIMEDAPFCIDD